MESQNLEIAGAPTMVSRDTSWREIPGHQRESQVDTLKERPENVYSKVGGEFKGREADL